MAKTDKPPPIPVVRRLIKYLAHLQYLQEQGVEYISSQNLAVQLGTTDATVRQDFLYISFSGKRKLGYEVNGLLKSINKILGLDLRRNAVVIGAGNLGRALVGHSEFSHQGFLIVDIFDVNPEIIGKYCDAFIVRDMKALPEIVKEKNVEIGILAVSAQAARTAAFELISAGVKGLVNLSSANLIISADIFLVNARIVESMQEVSYHLSAAK